MGSSSRTYNPLALAGVGRSPDHVPTPSEVEANVHHLIWEVTWYGLMVGTAINFMQVYVVRLGAPGLLVGAVTYGPALINVFWQMLAVRMMNRSGRRMRWVLAGGFTHRSVVLLIAVLPFVVKGWRPELTVLLLVLQAFPMGVASIGFLSMMADAVPADRLSALMSGRMVGYGVTTTLATLLAGRILDWLPFPLNYQVLFLIGFSASLVSQWHNAQLCVPDRDRIIGTLGRWWREPARTLRFPRFARFVTVVGVLQMTLGMLAPLLPLYWVRKLGATDVQISIIVTVYSGTTVLGSLLMRRIVGLAGRERTLAAAAFGYAVYPLLASLSPTIWWLVPWAALGGVFFSAISVTLIDNLVGVTPDEDRTTFIAVFNVFVNAALFLGPLAAGLLARNVAGLGLGLQIAAGISILAGLMCVRWLHTTGIESAPDDSPLSSLPEH